LDLSVLDHGAKGDGTTNDAQAIQKAIDTVAAAGGGIVRFPAGYTFFSGSLELKEKIELHLEKDSVLLASSNYEDYTDNHNIRNLTNGSVDEYVLPQRSFISGFKANGSSITGLGVIHGNADGFIETRGEYIHSMRAPLNGKSQYLERPFTIFLIESENVSLRDFTVHDPAFWAIRLTGCNDLEILGIKILTDLMVPNADGIDIDRCQRVRIADCELITADDCISLKSCAGTAQYGDVADVLIENCYMVSTSGAITLGTESVGDIRNVLVRNYVVERSHRGFAVRAREGGAIKDVVFENSKLQTRTFSDMWWGHGEALHVTAFAWNKKELIGDGNPERGLEGTVSNITFRNLEVESEAGILNWAAHPELVKGVLYEDIDFKIGSSSKWPHRIDLRPNDILPVVNRPHNAFEAVNVSDVRIKNLKITWDSASRANYGSEMFIENPPGFIAESVTDSIS
jgi:polygalacturonase